MKPLARQQQSSQFQPFSSIILLQHLSVAVSAGLYIAGLLNSLLNYGGVNLVLNANIVAVVTAVSIQFYFWRKKIIGIEESSEKALRIFQITSVLAGVLFIWSVATIFAGLILLLGLAARQVVKWKLASKPIPVEVAQAFSVPTRKRRRTSIPSTKYLLALKDVNDRLLKFALDEAKQRGALLFVLRVKEIAVGTLPERIEMKMNGEEEHIETICSTSGIDYQIISIPS
jgi:uncharacterized protein YjeT (DUF2065 family)